MKLAALPTELIDAISEHLELRDQLLLCRTSCHMHAICVKWIYRVLDFENHIQLLRCCKAIITRPQAAMSVREFKIPNLRCPTYALKSFFTIFRSAATRMQNLRSIDIRSPELFRTISDVVFPCLVDCIIPLALDSYSFLRRNPTIEYAFTFPASSQDTEFILNNPSHTEPIHMPHLQHFEGPEIAVCAVVPGSPVSTLTIWCPDPVMEYSRGLTAAASSKADLRILTNIIRSWDPALLRAIAKHTPRIQFLKIRNPIVSSSITEKENFLFAIGNTLRALSCLVALIVSDNTAVHPDRIGDALESEFERVRTWGDRCPTLVRVSSLSLSRAWGRFGALWLPVEYINESERVQCLKWLIKRIVISPELHPEYREVASSLVGADGIQVLADAFRQGEVLPLFDISPMGDGRVVILFPSDP
ncbi:hypothetical protein MSAN_00216600 [Mycena sanguinolenta]|uniref:F-box domain-containing protein n=1 Tax=Mycena sanguinolenta TaxID=230812 RepID=A0A8H6ZHK9_9AGAR|nr:hypothetical protein MSAN_00216600 [Mycena sanguinolenta]